MSLIPRLSSLGGRLTLKKTSIFARNSIPHGINPSLFASSRSFSSLHGGDPELFLLVEAYRRFGHYRAHVNPLVTKKKQRETPELDPQRYGIYDLDRKYNLTGIMEMPDKRPRATGHEIIEHLKTVYCGSVGAEITDLRLPEETEWLTKRLEQLPYEEVPSADKLTICNDLIGSETFDQFVARRSPQTKRYGLEGGESMIPAIRSFLETAASHHIKKVVIGMPHRGRLNLLTGLLELPSAHVFKKISGASELPSNHDESGDVLSHLAQSVDWTGPHGNQVHVSLLHNPSHLEAITPVACGKVRAIQDRAGRRGRDRNTEAVPLLLHGDSAFAGQGVIHETFLLSYLPGFMHGGSVHLVVNNQLGFTTPSLLARSSYYCTDIARMNKSPVLHVNGEEPETVRKICKLALEYRQAFGHDIIIDLIAYRRRGHNELDDPTLTEPTAYEEISSRATVAAQYQQSLIDNGLLDQSYDHRGTTWDSLDAEWQNKDTYEPPQFMTLGGNWTELERSGLKSDLVTGYDADTLVRIGNASVSVPPTLRLDVHSRLQERHLQQRREALSVAKPLVDWATAEAMAFGSLLRDGYHVRLCGQDSARGTFSQRHAEIICQDTERRYVPLNHMGGDQGQLSVVNSPLSELGVLGFEYGFSIQSPWTLCLWEAQFGDFFNTAQVIIDTFITNGEDKWLRQCGLVMLLPHGYDGAGPDHSSARMERFLQMVDTDSHAMTGVDHTNINFHFVFPTTPAQYFHLLRRQILRKYRKPLIVMAPKTILRLPQARSDVEQEMGIDSAFQPVLADNLPADKIDTVAFCSGKVWYEYQDERTARGKDNVALVRVEELAPFPYGAIEAELSRYPNAKRIVWAQEESKNAGAYAYIEPRFRRFTNGQPIEYVGRGPRAAPATGISGIHKQEKKDMMDALFA